MMVCTHIAPSVVPKTWASPITNHTHIYNIIILIRSATHRPQLNNHYRVQMEANWLYYFVPVSQHPETSVTCAQNINIR